jgi:glycosyltransferase involved in cell wall biosynthesis
MVRRFFMAPTAVPPQTVHVNGKWLASPITGTQRYANEITRELVRASDRTYELVLHLPSNAELPEWALSGCTTVRHSASGMRFEQLTLPVRTRGELLLNFGGPAPLLKLKQLVVMHDAATMRYPKSFSRLFVAWYWVMYLLLARTARHLVTVSEFSRVELSGALRVPETRFSVACCGHEHFSDLEPRTPVLPTRLDTQRDFVICVGTLAAHKNLVNPVRAMAEAGLQVVVIGAGGSERIFAQLTEPLPASAFLLGRITDAELAWCYEYALTLVFPSKYEGFGLPVLEAQSRGCPVVASAAASLPEVAGNAALYFHPDNSQELLIHVRSLKMDAGRRAGLVSAGYENVKRYTWRGAAQVIANLILGSP